MTVRARILDILPVLVVFALVTAFAMFVMVEYVVHDPVRVPPPQLAFDDVSHAAPADAPRST